MGEEDNKKRSDKAAAIRELYLYQDKSRAENVMRIGVWILSWLIGIILPGISDHKMLGSAYFIYSISLLADFITVERIHPIPKVINALFCMMQVIMVICSLCLIVGFVPTNIFVEEYIVIILHICGGLIIVMLLLDLVVVLLGLEKFYFDERVISEDEIDRLYEEAIKIFMDNLNGDRDRSGEK